METNRKILLIALTFPILLIGCKEDLSIAPKEDQVRLVDNSYDEVARLYMKDFQVTEEEAKHRLMMMSKSNMIANHLLEKYGEDNISAFYFDNTADNFGAVLHTTLEEDDTKILMEIKDDLNNTFDFPIEVKNNYPMNAQEINEYMQSKEDDLKIAVSGMQGYSYDPKKNSMEVDVYYDERNRLNKSQAQDVKTLSEIVPDMNISLNYYNEPIEVTASKVIYGGINITSTSAGICTLGFPANINGFDGFITARHCIGADLAGNINDPYYSRLIATNPGNNTSGQYLYLSSQDTSYVEGRKHELMFVGADDVQTTPYIFTGSYASDTNTPLYLPIKEVVPRINTRSKSFFQAGTYVCKYGRTTLQTCGEVTSTSYNPSKIVSGCAVKIYRGQSNTCDPTFVKVQGGNTLFCAKGDSGGPVYGLNSDNYGSAYGIMSSCSGSSNFGIYSSLDYISALGPNAYIKTVQ